MYLRRATIINSGPIQDIELQPSFNADGHPRPVILVGAAGSGKTGLLAVIADALGSKDIGLMS